MQACIRTEKQTSPEQYLPYYFSEYFLLQLIFFEMQVMSCYIDFLAHKWVSLETGGMVPCLCCLASPGASGPWEGSVVSAAR
jgi:hypothetical protein